MKKGFTLIELLAVIVILAVIAIIAIPTITNVVDKSKMSALKDSAYGLIDAGNLYYAQYSNSTSVRFDFTKDGSVTSNGEYKLGYKGNIKNGSLVINKKGQITVCINDGNYSAYKNAIENEVIVVNKKTCTIDSSTSIVYLDNESSIDEYDNITLTQIVQQLSEKIESQSKEISNLKSTQLDIDKIYPVGSIYISEENKNPSEIFGGTWEKYSEGKTLVGVNGEEKAGTTGGSSSVKLTASNIPSLTSTGSTTASNVTTNSTGSGYSIGYGTSTRTTSSAGAHTHSIQTWWNDVGATQGGKIAGTRYDASGASIDTTDTFSAGAHTHTVSDYYANSISGVQAHTHTLTIPALTATTTYTNNSQTNISVQNPYITVYMWKRTA